MYGLALRCCRAVAIAAMAVGLVACQNSVTPAQQGAAQGGWTTPPGAGETMAARPAQAGALQPAPRAVIAAPAAPSQPRLQRYAGSGMPPPPPPPDTSLPVFGVPPGGYTGAAATADPCAPCPPVAAVAPAAPVAQATRAVVPPRAATGCWPPCNDGISQWHIRGVVGLATFAGTDPAENCVYYGADIGRTFCGCWGLDFYYRYNSGRFDRTPAPGLGFKDGGAFHHFGAKVTFEKSLGQASKFYFWGGAGAGYFTTTDYIDNDSGGEIFLEAGVGYNLSRNWAIRAGVNTHIMDTSVTREFPVDDGRSRILWLIAPVLELEGRF